MNSVSTLSIAIASSNAAATAGIATVASDGGSPFAAILAPFGAVAAAAIRQAPAASGNGLPRVGGNLDGSDEVLADDFTAIAPAGPDRVPHTVALVSETPPAPPAPISGVPTPIVPYPALTILARSPQADPVPASTAIAAPIRGAIAPYRAAALSPQAFPAPGARQSPTGEMLPDDDGRDIASDRTQARDGGDRSGEPDDALPIAPSAPLLPYPALISVSPLANPLPARVDLTRQSGDSTPATVSPAPPPAALSDPQRPTRTHTPVIFEIGATDLAPPVASAAEARETLAPRPTITDRPTLAAPPFASPDIVATFGTAHDRRGATAPAPTGQQVAIRPAAASRATIVAAANQDPFPAPAHAATLDLDPIYADASRPTAPANVVDRSREGRTQAPLIDTTIRLYRDQPVDRTSNPATSPEHPSSVAISAKRPTTEQSPPRASAIEANPARSLYPVPGRVLPQPAIVTDAIDRPGLTLAPPTTRPSSFSAAPTIASPAAATAPGAGGATLLPTTNPAESITAQSAVQIEPRLPAKISSNFAAGPTADTGTTTIPRTAPSAHAGDAAATALVRPLPLAISRATAKPTRADPIVVGDVTLAGIAQPHAAAPAAVVQNTPLDMGRHGWPQAMIERIEALRDAADAADTSIRIVPDKLGMIDVSVRRDGDITHVHFAAEQAQTRTILADAQPRLAELAESRGLKLGEASIDGGTGQHQPQNHRQQTAAVAAAPARAPRRDEAAATDHRIA